MRSCPHCQTLSSIVRNTSTTFEYLSLEPSGIERNRVTTLTMHAPAPQAHVGSADVVANDNEITVLLLASDHWRGRAAPAIRNFARLISSLVEFKEQLLEQVIEC